MKTPDQGLSWRAPALLVLALLTSCGEDDAKRETVEEAPSVAVVADSVESLVAEREHLDATVFAPEIEAQRYEQVFVALWDELRTSDPFAVLKKFPFESLILGTPTPGIGETNWGVEGIRPAVLGPPERSLDHAEFVAMLDKFESAGWKIVQSEWHHSRFHPAAGEKAPQSSISFEIHALYKNRSQPIVLRGSLEVTWQADRKPFPTRIEARDVQIIARKGAPMFVEWMVIDPKQEAPGRLPRMSPILVHDLDGDGFSEIIAAGCNLVYRNKGGLRFEKEEFLSHPIIHPAEAGILADFTGDGIVDYVAGSAREGSLLLFVGEGTGRFPHPPVTCFNEKLTHLHALTAGDFDRDGDLDLFLGQWKAPYADGAMATPYYNANDGHPDYLLRNDGRGSFSDVTVRGGLAPLRNRRTFSASFVDLDGDHDLDLVVVADFSGLDLYRNRGDGTFENDTATMVDQRHGFGMSHTIGDWNGDGVLDLYMVGMSSTTARRLDGLGLGRPGFEKYSEMRAPMTFGNRLYVGDGKGRFALSPYAASAARTGWAWGCTSADFDLDGDEDLYIANGHLSGRSARDYCTRFWCHDLYTGNSKANPVLNEFFNNEFGMKLGRDYSWNGFEHNVLYLNQPGVGFFNAAFLLGVGFEFDSRAVVSEDLDADGRPDLLVVEYRTESMSQRLRVYRNQYESGNHWIGVRLPKAPQGETLPGATVTARAAKRVWIKPVVTGDSFTAQHSGTVHFGLGATEKIDSLTIRWPSGRETVIEGPKLDHYHTLGAPGAPQSAPTP